jgi:hypothetical protein
LTSPFVLISEARGEFLIVERIREELARRDVPSVHVTAHADDVGEGEVVSSGAIVLDRHDAYRRALALDAAALPDAVAAEQRALGANLRRVWQADLRSWRMGYPDDEMARISLASLAAWRVVLGELGAIRGIWGEDGGHLAKRSAFLVAEACDVRTVFVYVSPLPERLMVLDNPLSRFSRSAFDETEASPDERAYAEELLDDVRASRVQFAVPRDLSFGVGKIGRFAGLLLERYVRRSPGFASVHPWYFGRRYLRQRVGRASLAFRYEQIGERPFVFYPIHAGFDAQISVRAPQWENQLALIDHLAASLPYGYELAVKEHPFEVGALPLAQFHGLVRRKPEIRVLDPSIHAHRVLRACSAVATVNSTTGFEALFFQRPVVTFGHGPYRGLGLTHDVQDPFDTPQAMLAAVSSPPVDSEALVRLVAFLKRNSFPGRSLAYDAGAENIARHADIFAAAT